MKKVVLALPLLLVFSAVSFAQQFTVDGEVKTGILWTKFEDGIYEADETIGLGSKDDAGNGEGRLRINMAYANEESNMGFKLRLNWDNWGQTVNGVKVPDFPYAFGYGNFFEDQFTLSAGILGASPWGSGGPEMWKELETSGGMRFEIKPAAVPGELNVGFVLNYFDGYREAAQKVDLTLWEVLRESVLGISYTNDYFHARFAYRLDSDYDERIRGVAEGDELLYRIEERVIQNYLPGFRIWALGYYAGVGSTDDSAFLFTNWAFVEYAPDMFTAQLRFGADVISNRTVLHFRPSFYWNFLDRFIVLGAEFLYGQDFGEGKVYPGSAYYYMEAKPKVQVNFTPNAYVAFAYNWRRLYIRETPTHIDEGKEPLQQTQWMNLMVGLRF